jgi:hypothetical protein
MTFPTSKRYAEPVTVGKAPKTSSNTSSAFQRACSYSPKYLVHNQATSRGMDRCSLCGQSKTRLEFSWSLL